MDQAKRNKNQILFIVIVISIIIGFWFLYAIYDYLTLHEQLRFLFFREPLHFTDSLITHISSFSLVTRILVIGICVTSAFLIRNAFNRLQDKNQELEESNKKIQQSESRYKMLFNTNNDPIIMLKDWNITDCNRKALSLFDFRLKQDLISLPFLDLFPATQENNQSTRIAIQEIQRKIHDQDFDIRPFSFLVKTSKGMHIPCAITISPLLINEETYCQVLIRDTSLQKLYERELINARDKANYANHTKSVFISTLTHELVNPLNSIIGYSSLLQKETDPKAIKLYNQSVLRASKKINSLSRDILDLSKMESKKLEFRKEPCQLFRLKDSLYNTFYTKLKNDGITLKLVTPETDYCLVVDVEKVERIIYSLLNNTRKYTKSGDTIQVSITIADINVPSSEPTSIAEECTGHLKIVVQDNGSEIKKEYKDLILHDNNESFKIPTDTTLKTTDLLLLLAKQLTLALNGSLEITTNPDAGNKITIIIPDTPILLYQNPPSSSLKSSPPSTSRNSSSDHLKSPKKTVHILSVDENQNNLDVLQAMLHSISNIKVHSVHHDTLALEACREQVYNIIFIDLRFDLEAGVALAKSIRKLKNFETAPIIAVTDIHEAEDALNISLFNGILLKPVSIEALYTILVRFVPFE